MLLKTVAVTIGLALAGLLVPSAATAAQAGPVAVREGGTMTRIAAPAGEACWHVFHHATLLGPGPAGAPGIIPIGTLYYAADVCNDGTKAYLKPNGNTPGCWTDNGVTGTASLTWCGASNQYSNHMTLGGNMTVRVSVSYIVTINLPAVHVTLRSYVPPASSGVGSGGYLPTTATTDSPLTRVNVDCIGGCLPGM